METVLPKIRMKRESNVEAEDRRMVEEVRETSLRDVGISDSGSYERSVRHRVRDGRDKGVWQFHRLEP